MFFFLLLPILTWMPASVTANQDVYASLPADTRVIQYDMGDIDGDSREELAVLYLSQSRIRLALFRVQAGRWSRWGKDIDPSGEKAGAIPRSIEIYDSNGDGKDEVVIYSLAPDGSGMTTRIFSVRVEGSTVPVAFVLLEDVVSPPGYPLFGSEDGKPSVTFLIMPSERGGDGHRRVYCWEGDRFEKCVEVKWRK
jgi:hypothetical protein